MPQTIVQEGSAGAMAAAVEAFRMELAGATERLLGEAQRYAMGCPTSQALSFAVAAGLPPQLAYSVSQTSRYTGVPVRTLYDEIAAGRLRAILPDGRERGTVIRVDEVDRWLDETGRRSR